MSTRASERMLVARAGATNATANRPISRRDGQNRGRRAPKPQLIRCYGVLLGRSTRAGFLMEVSALKYSGGLGLHGRSPLLRLQSDERLVALDPAWQSARLRGPGQPLQLAPARLLPPPARLPRGRRGRAPGGARRRLQRDARRRPSDQRPAVALPDRAQPLPEPPAPRPGDRRRLDGHPLLRVRRQHRRQGPRPRGVPAPGRRHPRASRDAEDRARPARDGRPLLRADRRGDGDDRAERQVAAGARAGLARRGGRGAAALLRRGADRARRGRRGPAPQAQPARPPPPALLQALRVLPRAAQGDQQGARRADADRPVHPAQEDAGHAISGTRPARAPTASGAAGSHRRRHRRCRGHGRDRRRRYGSGRNRRPPDRIVAGSSATGFISAGVGAIATKAAAGLAAAALVTAGAVEVDHSGGHAASHIASSAALTHRALRSWRAQGRHPAQQARRRQAEALDPSARCVPAKKPATTKTLVAAVTPTTTTTPAADDDHDTRDRDHPAHGNHPAGDAARAGPRPRPTRPCCRRRAPRPPQRRPRPPCRRSSSRRPRRRRTRRRRPPPRRRTSRPPPRRRPTPRRIRRTRNTG